MDKTTTQHRLVINAAKEFEGRCINDFIAKTPDVMNNLYGVLLRFRQGPCTYTADIQRMFLQVEIEPEDRRYVRVLYQPVRPGPIHLVECQRHMFGLRSSPYVAMEIIKTHAREHQDNWPSAARAVLHSSIVDDVLVSLESETEVRRLHRELGLMFSTMSMEIHKCASNLERFVADLDPSKRAKQVRLEEISSVNPELMPVIKTLGMVYEPQDDVFRFEYAHENPRRWTLRSMASAVARVYDPLGLVTPFLMSGRAIVQLIWLEGKKWDDPLNEFTSKKCELWTLRAKELVQLRIPRRVVGLLPSRAARLTVFCDACRLGYAAVVYSTQDGNTSLVASRGRVAPARKDESVQRLELAGCQLAVSVASEVCAALGVDIGTLTFYTDSMTALAWLRTTSKMSVFVSNRVCKVRDRTDLAQWRHVPGEINPADLASRGCRPRRLVEDPMWLSGPEFLRTGEEPEQPDLVEDEAVKEELVSFDNHLRKIVLFRYLICPMEITPFMVAFVAERELPGRAVRVLARVIEATRRLRRLPAEPETPTTLYQELWHGIMVLRVREHQREAWPEEVSLLERGREPRSLRQLRPELDSEGVMRMNSRLNHCWWLSYAARNPIILKPGGELTRQLMRHFHAEQLRHAGGPGQLLGAVRKEFWITNPRALARKTVEDCRECCRARQRRYRPAMGALHPARLGGGQPLRAFAHVGVDMAGPFLTKGPPTTRGRRPDHKRYLLITSCQTTRAVCLEMMHTADAASCLMALERFAAVYGRPDAIYSDCGTNFVGARSELQQRWQWWRQVARESSAVFPNMRWEMNPPYSPNWGGHYERLIGLAKNILGKVMAHHVGVLGDEELQTFFKRTQDLLNNRPIVAEVQDDDDYEVLTPSCFLKTARDGPILPAGPPRTGLVQRYRLLEDITKQYWKQFISAYVPTLHKTEKWHRREPPLEVGDIVNVLHPSTPFNRWPVGRVIRVYPGRDGQTRSVEVEIRQGKERKVVRRSASGLRLLLKE